MCFFRNNLGWSVNECMYDISYYIQKEAEVQQHAGFVMQLNLAECCLSYPELSAHLVECSQGSETTKSFA